MKRRNSPIQTTLHREITQTGNTWPNPTAVSFQSSLIASLHLNYFRYTSASHLGVVLLYRQHLAVFKDLVVTTEERERDCYWHLVGRHQECD